MILNLIQALSQTPYNETTESFVIELLKKNLKIQKFFYIKIMKKEVKNNFNK